MFNDEHFCDIDGQAIKVDPDGTKLSKGQKGSGKDKSDGGGIGDFFGDLFSGGTGGNGSLGDIDAPYAKKISYDMAWAIYEAMANDSANTCKLPIAVWAAFGEMESKHGQMKGAMWDVIDHDSAGLFQFRVDTFNSHSGKKIQNPGDAKDKDADPRFQPEDSARAALDLVCGFGGNWKSDDGLKMLFVKYQSGESAYEKWSDVPKSSRAYAYAERGSALVRFYKTGKWNAPKVSDEHAEWARAEPKAPAGEKFYGLGPEIASEHSSVAGVTVSHGVDLASGAAGAAGAAGVASISLPISERLLLPVVLEL